MSVDGWEAPTMGMYLIIGLIAIGIGGMIFAATLIFARDNAEVEDRLANLTKNGGRGNTATADELNESSFLRTPFDEQPDQIEAFVSKFLGGFNLGKIIEQSGLELSVSKFVLITLGAAGIGGFLAFMFSPFMIVVPVVVTLGLLGPALYVFWCRSRRLKKFDLQLPAALDLMCQALRAGQSLPAGIQLVGQQGEAPLGPEFQQAFESQNLGASISESLEAMCERVPSLDLRFFSTAVILQRQTGGDLAEILDNISKLMRERVQIRGQIQALTGEGRISGAVLLALPPGLFLFMLRINYDYVMMLLNEPLGNKMLIGAIILQVLGALWIRKIINIKV